MPKVFLTGSGVTKGYLTGSGNINNPVRVLLKNKDNQGGKRPSKLRFGTSDRKGNESISYQDKNTIMFGSKIEDFFEFAKNDLIRTEKKPNSKKWDYSEGIKIRRKLDFLQNESQNGSLVFEGRTDSNGERWIRTKEKIRNPDLIFKIFQGPYQENSKKLNLSQGKATDILKIQISYDNATWEDVTINKNNVSNELFLDGNSYFTPTFNNASTNNRLESYVRLTPANFISSPGKDFYLRIVQTSVSDENTAVWAIDSIKIISRNDSISYPLSFNQKLESFSLTSTGSIATPNKYPELNATGSSVKNVSDLNIDFEIFESDIKPYSDNKPLDDNGKSFYDEGVSPFSYPGFNSPLSSKDVIEIDLSTETKTDLLKLENSIPSFGHAITGSGGLGCNIMVYWNNDLKRWEKIGFPIGVNDFGADTTGENIVNILSSSAVGFSSCGVMITGSGATIDPDPTATLLSNDLLNSYNRPTDTFGFPFSGRYYATGSQYVLAKDLGIVKPFIFEKAVLDFDMRGRVNYDFGGFDGLYLQNTYYKDITSTPAIRHGTPTFFILNQRKENFSNVKINVYTGSQDSEIVSYQESLPGNFQLNSGSSELTYVDETRELITYGQHTIIVSSSYPHPVADNKTPSVSFKDFLNSPIVRDNHTVFTTFQRLSTTQFYFTSSFRTEFKCRNTSIISPFAPYYIVNTPGAIGGGSGYSRYANLRMGKELSGRSSGDLSKEGRSLFNGFSAFNPSKISRSIQYVDVPQISGGNTFFTNPVIVAKGDGVDLDSPYIIMPEDKLIFGWQAPISFRRISADLDTTYITLFGNSKLKLYGSLIKDGKEYHEGINQNLTTDSIFETIGDASSLDKLELATRGELTGSWHTQHTTPVNYNSLSSYERERVPAGSNILTPKRFKSIVTSRIGQETYDIINKELRSSLEASGDDYLIGSLYKNAFNFVLTDINREIIDTDTEETLGKRKTQLITSSSSDGTVYTKNGRNEKLGHFSQYVFSNNHFGFMSDLIKQGIDTKFEDDPNIIEDDILTSSPIKIVFVNSVIVDEELGVKNYTLIDPALIDGTAEQDFQSSNLNTDGSISSIINTDDTTLSNRSYNTKEVVIF